MRRKDDFYETSGYAVTELLKHTSIGGTVFECCVGMGAIYRPLREHIPGSSILTNDIDVKLPAALHLDISKKESWNGLDTIVNWTVTNPPFNKAFPILVHAYDQSITGVAMLLRLSFLEPTYERQDWLHDHPPTRLIVLPRYSFTGDGKTDSVTAAWMVWIKATPWVRNNSIIITKK